MSSPRRSQIGGAVAVEESKGLVDAGDEILTSHLPESLEVLSERYGSLMQMAQQLEKEYLNAQRSGIAHEVRRVVSNAQSLLQQTSDLVETDITRVAEDLTELLQDQTDAVTALTFDVSLLSAELASHQRRHLHQCLVDMEMPNGKPTAAKPGRKEGEKGTNSAPSSSPPTSSPLSSMGIRDLPLESIFSTETMQRLQQQREERERERERLLRGREKMNVSFAEGATSSAQQLAPPVNTDREPTAAITENRANSPKGKDVAERKPTERRETADPILNNRETTAVKSADKKSTRGSTVSRR